MQWTNLMLWKDIKMTKEELLEIQYANKISIKGPITKNLKSVIKQHSKSQLVNLANNYLFDVDHNTKKDDLIEMISEVMSDEAILFSFLTLVTPYEMEILEKVYTKLQVEVDPYKMAQVRYLHGMSFINVYKENNHYIYEMPDAIRQQIDSSGIESYKSRCEMVHANRMMLRAVVNLYGVIRLEKAYELLSKIEGSSLENIDYEHFELICGMLTLRRDQFDIDDGLLMSDYFLDGLEDQLMGQILSNDKPYYQPNLQTLMPYSDSFYQEENSAYLALRHYLQKKFKHKKDMDEIMDELSYHSMFGGPMDGLNYLNDEGIVYNNDKDLKTCMDLFMDYSNNKRLWVNHGHTPNEIGEMAGSFSQGFDDFSDDVDSQAYNKYYKKMKKPIGKTRSLKKMLERYTKVELLGACLDNNIEISANAKKQEVINRMVREIPHVFKASLQDLSSEVLQVYEVFGKQNGRVEFGTLVEYNEVNSMPRGLEDLWIASLNMFIYPYIEVVNGVEMMVNYLPDELLSIVKVLDMSQFNELLKEEQEILETCGLVIQAYGVANIDFMLSFFEASRPEMTEETLEDVFISGRDHLIDYGIEPYLDWGYCTAKVANPFEVVFFVEEHGEIPYKTMDLDQLKPLQARSVYKSMAVKRFRKYMNNAYDVPKHILEGAIEGIVDEIRQDKDLEDLCKGITADMGIGFFADEKAEFHNQFMKMAVQIPTYYLKGHSIAECDALYGTNFNQFYEIQGQVVSLEAHKKVSRNSPCPCGSGKKYKHCCGR